MKKIAAILLAGTFMYAASTACDGIYYKDSAPDIVNTKIKPKTKEVCYSEYGVMHSGLTKTPLWSGEFLTPIRLSHPKIERSNDFHPEGKLSAQDRAELEDYSRSGYDRGHMAPAADFSTSKAERESYSLANMVPQNPENNRGIWANVERSVRDMAKRSGSLYVVTGPMFLGQTLSRINRRVIIPTHIFKAIYSPTLNLGSAYVSRNDSSGTYEKVSIKELESRVGYVVFPGATTMDKVKMLDLPAPVDKRGAPAVYPMPKAMPSSSGASDFSCGQKKTCSQMSSCAEARYFLNQCGQSFLDGDQDGTPCEKICN